MVIKTFVRITYHLLSSESSDLPYCRTSTQMESVEVMLASGDFIAAQVFHMLKKRKTGIAVKPKMARKARARM